LLLLSTRRAGDASASQLKLSVLSPSPSTFPTLILIRIRSAISNFHSVRFSFQSFAFIALSLSQLHAMRVGVRQTAYYGI